MTARKKLSLVARCAALFLVGALAVPADPPARKDESRVTAQTLHGTRQRLSLRIARNWASVTMGDRLLVLDSQSHQVAAKQSAENWSLFGSIGNGPGEFFHPSEIAVDPMGQKIAVYDAGNHRVQVFDETFRLLATVAVQKKVYGLAWWRGGYLLLGQPEEGALLSIYDPREGFVGTVGESATPSEFSRLQPGFRRTYSKAVNRTRIVTTSKGDIWVAFLHLPLVRRYSSDGRLVGERPLVLDGLGPLPSYYEAVWDRSIDPPSATYINIDGVQLPLLIKDIAVHSDTGTALLLLGNDWVATLDHGLRLRLVSEVVGCAGTFNRLAIDAPRRVLLLTSLEESALCEVNLDALLGVSPSDAGSEGAAEH